MGREFVTRPDGTRRWEWVGEDAPVRRRPKPAPEVSVFDFWNALPLATHGDDVVIDWCEPLDPMYRVAK